MPPKFSLQTVLDVRHSKVESIEIEMGRQIQLRSQKESYLGACYAAQDKLYETLHEHMIGEMDLFVINHLRSNINQISNQIQATSDQIASLSASIEETRLSLIEAKKEEEALAILKNKEYERFQEEEKEKDKRLVDDVYISQGFRQRRSQANQ